MIGKLGAHAYHPCEFPYRVAHSVGVFVGWNGRVFDITWFESILIHVHAVYDVHHHPLSSLAHCVPLAVFFRTCPTLHALLGYNVLLITLLESILIQSHAEYELHHQLSFPHSYQLAVFFSTCHVLH